MRLYTCELSSTYHKYYKIGDYTFLDDIFNKKGLM